MKVSIAVAFLICSGNEFQTEGPKQEKRTITFCLALIERNFEETGVSIGAKRSRRRIQM